MLGAAAIAVTVVSFASGGDAGIGRGFAELLRLDLGRVPGISVAPLLDASALEQSSDEGRRAIARRQHAQYVLLGSIQTNDGLATHLTLIDAEGREAAVLEKSGDPA